MYKILLLILIMSFDYVYSYDFKDNGFFVERGRLVLEYEVSNAIKGDYFTIHIIGKNKQELHKQDIDVKNGKNTAIVLTIMFKAEDIKWYYVETGGGRKNHNFDETLVLGFPVGGRCSDYIPKNTRITKSNNGIIYYAAWDENNLLKPFITSTKISESDYLPMEIGCKDNSIVSYMLAIINKKNKVEIIDNELGKHRYYYKDEAILWCTQRFEITFHVDALKIQRRDILEFSWCNK